MKGSCTIARQQKESWVAWGPWEYHNESNRAGKFLEVERKMASEKEGQQLLHHLTQAKVAAVGRGLVI